MRAILAVLILSLALPAWAKVKDPGEALDQEVAKEVMGWGDPQPVSDIFIGAEPAPVGYEYREGNKIHFPRAFSTDDAAANMALRKLQRDGADPVVEEEGPSDWGCTVNIEGNGRDKVNGTTRAHAISLGGLKSKNKPVEAHLANGGDVQEARKP